MVTAGATANTMEGNSRASKESGSLCSYSHGASIALHYLLAKIASFFFSSHPFSYPLTALPCAFACFITFFSLKRGFQLQVLGFTLHYLLAKLVPTIEIGSLDYCAPTLNRIILADVFGEAADKKEDAHICKSYR